MRHRQTLTVLEVRRRPSPRRRAHPAIQIEDRVVNVLMGRTVEITARPEPLGDITMASLLSSMPPSTDCSAAGPARAAESSAGRPESVADCPRSINHCHRAAPPPAHSLTRIEREFGQADLTVSPLPTNAAHGYNPEER